MHRSTAAPPSSRLRRAEYALVASLALFLALVAAAALIAGAGEVWGHMRGLAAPVLGIMLLLSLANYLARAGRWQLFSRHLELEVPPGRNGLYYVAGFALTTTPGKLGEAVRLWLLERGHGCGYARSAPLFVADRVSDLNAILLLCLLGVAAVSGFHWIVAGAMLAALVVSVLLMRPALLLASLGLVHRWLGRPHRPLVRKLRQTLALTGRLFAPRVLGVALLLSVAGWLAECLAFYWLLAALGAPVDLLQATFIFSFAMLAGALSMLPGGLGGVEAVMVALLLALGTEAHLAVAATALIRLTTLWFAVALGVAALPLALHLARPGRRAVTSEARP